LFFSPIFLRRSLAKSAHNHLQQNGLSFSQSLPAVLPLKKPYFFNLFSLAVKPGFQAASAIR